MRKLANSKVSKVLDDAQNNLYTSIDVDGLSAYYHRLLSLGHDPLLGFVIGVADILTGRMTSIDKSGKIVSQVMEVYADRKESDILQHWQSRSFILNPILRLQWGSRLHCEPV